MKMLLGAAAAAGLTLLGSAASAQPYGYHGQSYYGQGYYGQSYDYGRYGARYDRSYRRDRDRDGIPDRWDRYDNRRDRHHRHHHRDRYDSYRYGYGWRY